MERTTHDAPTGTFVPKRRFSIRRIPWGTILALTAIAFAAIVVMISIVQILYASRIQTEIARIRSKPVAIVLGASVKRDGTPSDALEDRIKGAVELYEKGFVDKLLMSGDDGAYHINEIRTMVEVAEASGVPSKDIWTDGHGYRTYESCRRAVEEYQITEAVIVTQRFHMGRALFLCNQLGMDAIGYAVDQQAYEKGTYFWLRDLLSSVKAFFDIYISNPDPPVTYEKAI